MKNSIKNLPLCNSGKSYIRVGGENREAFEIAKLEASLDLTVSSKVLLGERMAQNRVVSSKGNCSMTVYNASKVFREAVKTFHDTGVFPPISVQAYSDDPATSLGRLEVVLYDFIPTSIPLLKLEEDSEDYASFDLSGTFDGYDVLSEFGLPTGY